MLDSIVICVVLTGHLYVEIGQSAISFNIVYGECIDPRKQNNIYEEKRNGLNDEERKSVIHFQSAQY